MYSFISTLLGNIVTILLSKIKYIVNKAIENKTDCLLILHSICKKGHPLEHDLYSWEWEKFEALCVYIHSLEVKGKLKSVLSKDLILK